MTRVQEFSFKGNTYKVVAHDRIASDPSWHTHVDESTVRDRDWNIGPGDVIIDVGSCYGSYALTALASGAASVHCWSPVAEQTKTFLQSVALNGWEDRVHVYEYGLYSKTGWLDDLTQEFADSPLPEGSGGSVFQVRRLDESGVSFAPGKMWIKVDVEGAEVDVLEGARGLILERGPTVLVENHVFKDATIEDRVRATMESMKYVQKSCHPHHSVTHAVYEPM